MKVFNFYCLSHLTPTNLKALSFLPGVRGSFLPFLTFKDRNNTVAFQGLTSQPGYSAQAYLNVRDGRIQGT